MSDFEPVIIGYCCHYCAYTAADMAGSMRICYPFNAKLIRVPCSGKVGTIHILRALQKGADGVFVAGCLEGDCHFKDGNVKAAKRVQHAKKILEEAGIGERRVKMMTISAGMGKEFAQAVEEFTNEIKKLGPNPVKETLMKMVKKAV
jgi:coenzyme F420-reducing hydrogenase delta subunit